MWEAATNHSLRLFPKLLLCVFLLLSASPTLADCRIDNPSGDSSTRFQLVPGINTLSLECQLEQTRVIIFDSVAIDGISANRALPEFNSAPFAYELSPGTQRITLTISATIETTADFRLSSPHAFYQWSTRHALTMGAFAGICLALCIYVAMLGRGMRENAFYAYSAYVISACIFFLIQERIINIVIPGLPLIHDIYSLSLWAGLTVFTGTRFLSLLLDFKRLLPMPLYIVLTLLSFTMVFLAAIPALFQTPKLHFMLEAMGMVTTVISVFVLLANIWAIVKGVHVASMVLSAQVLLGSSMFVRLYLADSFPFLAQYSLIIALSMEAFILAIAVSEKVKRLNEQKEAAQTSASTDDLCPVLNRRGWYREALIRLDALKGTEDKLVVIFIDIDKFKQINDVFGHLSGDEVLIAFANIIKHQARPSDVIGRLGGDEFVIMSPCKTQTHAQKIVERLHDRLDRLRINIDDKQIPVTASIGFQIATAENNELSVLLHSSDVAMYKEKAAKAL